MRARPAIILADSILHTALIARWVFEVDMFSEIPLPKLQHGPVEMKRGFAVTDVVLPHRVDHHIEELAGLDQRINKRLRVLRVNVVIISAMNEQEPPMKFARALDERGALVSVRIFRRRFQERLGYLSVVVAPVCDGRHSDTGLEFRRAGHEIESHKASVAPSPDANALRVHPRLRLQPSRRIEQVGRFRLAQLPLNSVLKTLADRRRRPIVYFKHDVAFGK